MVGGLSWLSLVISVELTPALNRIKTNPVSRAYRPYEPHILLCYTILRMPCSVIIEILPRFFLHCSSSVSMPAVLFGTPNCSTTCSSLSRCSLGVLRWRMCVLMRLKIGAFNGKTFSNVGILKRDSTSLKRADRRGRWREHNRWVVGPRHQALLYAMSSYQGSNPSR